MDGNMSPADIMALTNGNENNTMWSNPLQMYYFCII